MDVMLLNPLFWITLLVVISFFIKKIRIRRLFRNAGFILFLVLTNNGLSSFSFRLWEYETIEVKDISEPYDIGIVLGPFLWQGRGLPNGKDIIQGEHARFFQAIQLYKKGVFKKFLLSGYDNVDYTQSYLVSLGIPSDNILMESESKNTHENALFSKRFLIQNGVSLSRLLLITSAYHMRRAKKCFDNVGLKVTPFSVDYWMPNFGLKNGDWIIPNTTALRKWKLLCREWAAMLFFKYKSGVGSLYMSILSHSKSML